MITRGHYLGEIIDDFSTLSAQIKMRNALGFTDLTVFAENFMRDVLNVILNVKLENLNAERSNEPGLDLGDINNEIAFQITSSATSRKIKNTLEKITPDQERFYKKIIILDMGKKQSKYSIDEVLSKKHSFSEKGIWDFNSIARKAVDLEIEKLQDLYNLVHKNAVRLKVELELPDQEGKYPTNSYEQWEEKIIPQSGDGEGFISYLQDIIGYNLKNEEVDNIKSSLKTLGNELSKLPRVTREFLAVLYERRETKESKRFDVTRGWQSLFLGKVQREFQGGDLKGELDILVNAEFIYIDGEEPAHNGPPEIGLKIPVESYELQLSFVDYINEKKLSFRKVIGGSDLSEF